MNSLILWFILRALISIITGLVSSIKPMTPIEKMIPFLPPSVPINQWLERVFISPWMRWDALWYQRIVTQGYSGTDGTAQFHPLYPWLATPLANLGILPGLSLLIISSLAGIALFYFFVKLAQFELTPNDSYFALMLFAFAPPALILFAPYSEALFLLTAVLSILYARQKKWWLAGMMGGLAVLTRQQGILLLIPIAWELWEDADHSIRNIRLHWRNWLALILIPIGMLVWLIYRAFFLNDIHLNFSSLHELIYSFAISPSAVKVVPDQQFIWPWQALYNSFVKLFTKPDIDIWVNLIAAIIFLIAVAFAWRKIRLSYRLYVLVIILVSFSYYTGPVHPYMGLIRHLFLAFPIFFGLAALIKRSWIRLSIVGASAIGMSFLSVLYVLQAWVP